MSIKTEVWGKSPKGKDVHRFTLTNAMGASISVIEWGAILQSIESDGLLVYCASSGPLLVGSFLVLNIPSGLGATGCPVQSSAVGAQIAHLQVSGFGHNHATRWSVGEGSLGDEVALGCGNSVNTVNRANHYWPFKCSFAVANTS